MQCLRISLSMARIYDMNFKQRKMENNRIKSINICFMKKHMFPFSHKYLITVYITRTWLKSNIIHFSLLIFLYSYGKINFKISIFNYLPSCWNLSITFLEKYTLITIYYIDLMKHINDFA